MTTKKNLPDRQESFSRRFNKAIVATRVTDAMVRADGWGLTSLVEAPKWLKDLYDRHADAACAEMRAIHDQENDLKPSEHK